MIANLTNPEFCYLAGRYPGALAHLYSPGSEPARGSIHFFPYALDNGAYVAWEKGQAFDFDSWRRLLDWGAKAYSQPLWVLVPDSVANKDETLERWYKYSPEVISRGFQPAFAAQDGMIPSDAPPDCIIFLGGTTPWKESAIQPWCSVLPNRVHVGRVNNTRRLMKCYHAGAISVDGTGWWHKSSVRGKVIDLDNINSQPERDRWNGLSGQMRELIDFVEGTNE